MTKGITPTVTVVEDEHEVRDSLAAVISAHGFNVASFASGRDFLDGHSAGATDCLVIDIHMPGVTGLDVLKSLRTSGDFTPVILITGIIDPHVHERGRALGAAAVLYKPMVLSELLATIQMALATRKP